MCSSCKFFGIYVNRVDIMICNVKLSVEGEILEFIVEAENFEECCKRGGEILDMFKGHDLTEYCIREVEDDSSLCNN